MKNEVLWLATNTFFLQQLQNQIEQLWRFSLTKDQCLAQVHEFFTQNFLETTVAELAGSWSRSEYRETP